MSYKPLSIQERELLLIHLMQGLSLCKIAKLLGRNKSTISRELVRNPGEYLPSKATARYRRRRKKCRPHKIRSCSRCSKNCSLTSIGRPNKLPIVSSSKITRFK